MTPSPDQFKPLLRLLACKRHEQPPPGYFDSFSRKVMARLEADDLSEHSTWWEWIDRFDASFALRIAISDCSDRFQAFQILRMNLQPHR